MSIPKHAIAYNASSGGKIAGNSPLLSPLFQNTPDPPKNLYYRGNLTLLEPRFKRIAVVGSRKVTPYGKRVTTKLSAELAHSGMVIVSGLALGVDSLAHRAAVEAGKPTIAVLPGDVQHIYPRGHTQLAQQILEDGGLLLSEYVESVHPQKFQFIARNRLIAGVSEAVLITEAAHGSGSLHTAGFAMEQGKAVIATPGNIDSPLSEGTNRLIQTGAALVTCSSDIFEALGYQPLESYKQAAVQGSNDQETSILELLQQGITEGSVLLRRSQLPAAIFNQTLTMLEITGKIRALGVGQWTIR